MYGACTRSGGRIGERLCHDQSAYVVTRVGAWDEKAGRCEKAVRPTQQLLWIDWRAVSFDSAPSGETEVGYWDVKDG
jgi:hypothetical protein